jgi:hypothetical protein
MKKTFCVGLMLCVTAFAAFAQSAVIRELTGEVQLKHAGASAFVPAVAGSEVAQDTIVSTGFRSSAIIAAGGSVITVRPLTRLTLAEIQSSSGAENININLQSGRVRVDVTPPAGARANFTVQSPSATASVRGTSFEFDTRSLWVTEGTVSFRGSSGIAIPVSAGGESCVGNEGKAIHPAQIAGTYLLPSAPVGTDSTAGATTLAAGPSNGDITLGLEFE